MRSVKKAQIALFIGALTLFVLLIFANKKPDANELNGASVKESSDAAGGLKQLVDRHQSQLPGDGKASLQQLASRLERSDNNEKLIILDSLIHLSNKFNKPIIAAFYAEQKALVNPIWDNWFRAGQHYYNAVRFTEEKDRQILFQQAIKNFSTALEKDSTKLDAKTSLAVCYVEGSMNPMKGITMLREVVQADPDNLDAHLNLGLFSLKSGQNEKAIERFNRILEIQPDYIEAYLFLADAYERLGDKENAIKSLEKYKSVVDDAGLKTEVQNYINKLKNS